MKELITPISPEKQSKRGWKVKINDEEMKNVRTLTIENPHFGKLKYGETSGGWDGWIFEEIGGGSVIVPYVILGNEVYPQLYIGVVKQKRENQGGEIWNLPRGFLASGEDHFMTAVREAGEEIRLDISSRMKQLPGSPVNSNSAFFVSDEFGEKGVKFFSFELKPEEIILKEEEDAYFIDKNILLPKSKQAEQIAGSKLVPWDATMQLGDMFTRAGVGSLLAELWKRK